MHRVLIYYGEVFLKCSDVNGVPKAIGLGGQLLFCHSNSIHYLKTSLHANDNNAFCFIPHGSIMPL